jgi:hypothetical protein
MTSYSDEPNISIEKDSQLERHELGRNADQFQSLMLARQDFDDGIEKFVRRATLNASFMTPDFQ